MPRMMDYDCASCGFQIRDKFFMEVPDVHPCPQCGAAMDRAWYVLRRERTQWDDASAVVVFRDREGKIRYPGRNDVPTPADCERVVMRSLREVESFEKQHGVRSEMAWYDKGSGRGFDDTYRGQDYKH